MGIQRTSPRISEAQIGYISSAYSTLAAGPVELDSKMRTKLDLTRARRVRLVVNVDAVGAAGSWARAQYSTDAGGSWAYFDGAAEPSASLAATGVATSSWVDMPAAAKADVLVRHVAGGGNSVASPTVRLPRLQIEA